MYMSVLPAFFYLLICFHTTTDFQIRAAAFLSAVYAIIMMSVVVGTTIQIAEDSWTSPNAVFLMLLFSIFFIAACMHPQEFWCIVPGLLYFICIPSGYLFLLIYSLCNLNIVSWGTREAPKVKKNQSKEEMERARLQELTQAKQKSAGFLNQVRINSENRNIRLTILFQRYLQILILKNMMKEYVLMHVNGLVLNDLD
jgi:chitin synthase